MAVALVVALAALPGCRGQDGDGGAAGADYDPLAVAAAVGRAVANPEAAVPPMCYTATGGTSNPCWVCHTAGTGTFGLSDWELQREYAFSDFALTNRWTNLFEDRTAFIAGVTDADISAWVRQDNYQPLRDALAGRGDYAGYAPDLDLGRGFDDDGLARDGSGWRAVRYHPLAGSFWPTNGSADDVFVRLPDAFRQGADGRPSRAVYLRNLDIVATAIGAPDDAPLPAAYAGAAASVAVERGLYPAGVEFLHSVRYLDPDAPALAARRMKELRYSRKVTAPDAWGILRAQEEERDAKDRGLLPRYRGSPAVGLLTDYGWQLQGFIEDAQGRLRLQTQEEHQFCMGCHSAIGVTRDHTFALARKLPGAAGWRPQDLRGMKDRPQLGHAEPEVMTYLARVGGGDELRANDEMLRRWLTPDGQVRRDEVVRAAAGGDRDLAWLLAPSRARALALNKAYLAIVRDQSFTKGRDAVLTPARNVHRRIDNGSTELDRTGMVFRDGQLRLDWAWTQPSPPSPSSSSSARP